MKLYRGFFVLVSCLSLAWTAAAAAESTVAKKKPRNAAIAAPTRSCPGNSRCLDKVKHTSGRTIYAVQGTTGKHYLIHPSGQPKAVPAIGVKSADSFDTYGIVTLEESPTGTRCTADPAALVEGGTKLFVQKDGGDPMLYLIKGGRSAELALKAVHVNPADPASDVLWMQASSPAGFDYFVFLHDARCSSGAFGKVVRVEAFPSADTPQNHQCFAERPDQPNGWALNTSPPGTVCEVGSGGNGDPDHPH